MSNDLPRRLRALVIIDEVRSNNALGREAAAALEAAEAEIGRLRTALEAAHRYLDAAQWWHGDHHRAVKDVLAILNAALSEKEET